MGVELFINIVITIICLMALGLYFNRREKKLQFLATSKFREIEELYLHQLAKRKVKERHEVEKLKNIVDGLEEKHKKLLAEKNAQQNHLKGYSAEADKIIKAAQEKANAIEEEVRQKSKLFLKEQEAEVRSKMVDLVIGVTKKVIARNLTYLDHKELIEKAVLEMEGEETDAK